MSWLRKALGLCQHKWQEVERYRVNRGLDGKQIGTLYIMRCEHCGEMTRRRV